MKITGLNSNNAWLRNSLFLAIGLVIFMISRNFGMFWDNILFTTISGDYLYNNAVFNWNFPVKIDTGHPPFLGTLLAFFWKIFGQKLWVAHLVILPFTFGIFYQLHRFSFYYLKNHTWALLSTLLVVADPTLSVQFFNVNPEVIFIFFFLLTINAILFKQRFLKIIGLAFLSIISLRSMMLAAGVFIFDVLNQRWLEKKKFKLIVNKEFITSYVLGSIPGVVFVIWRLLTKGYIQTHPDSPWEGFWNLASWDVLLRNIMILIHRFLDFGRFFIVLFLILGLILLKRKFFTKDIKQVILLGISSVILVTLINSLSTNTMGHRYFITGYMMLTFTAVLVLQRFKKHKRLIYTILLIGLLSGNLWVYPRKIAQGWDASLAHAPFHKLRNEAIQYLDSQSIYTKDVGSFAIYTLPFHFVDLSGDWRHFEAYDGTNEYLFYSNINNLKDEEYAYIDQNYTIIKEFKQYPVHIYIYKKNNYATH